MKTAVYFQTLTEKIKSSNNDIIKREEGLKASQKIKIIDSVLSQSKLIIFLSQQRAAVAHLRNIRHPSELLVPPVPVQDQVSQRPQGQTLWRKKKQNKPSFFSQTMSTLKFHSNKLVSTPTFLNQSVDPSRGPYSDVGDSFLQQLHLLLYLYRQKDRLLRKCVIVHSSDACYVRHRHYLNMFCEKFYCFGCTLEGRQLPGDDTHSAQLKSCNGGNSTNVSKRASLT